MRLYARTLLGGAVAAGFVAMGAAALAAAPPAAPAEPPRPPVSQAELDRLFPKVPAAPYRVDASWPKELPGPYSIHGVGGLFVDHLDHVWVYTRPRELNEWDNSATLHPPTAECCIQSPAVLEFDAQGNLLNRWGVPGMVPGWPGSEHTILVDRQRNVWIGGSNTGDTLLKFTADGKFISDFGHRPPPEMIAQGRNLKENNQQTDVFMRGVAAATFDDAAGEIYIADGYLNRRILVYDMNTGAFKRGWGAYGKALAEIDNEVDPPYDPNAATPAKDFKAPVHCVRISKDNLVYVCDRGGNRVQVFTKQGKFVKEFFVAKNTLQRGSVGSIDFSHDPAQKYLYIGDVMNHTVWQVDRQSGKTVGRIGRQGNLAGQFSLVHVAAMDSKGNMYVGEVVNGRVQKFVPTR